MSGEPSREKKQAMIAFAKWVRMLVPSLPETALVKEYWDRMTATQRRRVARRLAELDAME